MKFEDHFSKQAVAYARHRPRYPDQLYKYLAALVAEQELAWDCGAGNGQAALGLVRHFKRVVATDASAEQIAQAYRHPRVQYLLEQAERASFPSGSCDLVTVAVAVHWFELKLFYQEIERVLKPGGLLAVWTYHLPIIDPAIDRVITLYYEMLSGHWPERFHFVDERYQTLPFPFVEVTPPSLEMREEWDLNQLTGFLVSWSATQRYLQAYGRHPLADFWPELVRAWEKPDEKRLIRWPLFMRIGRTRL